MLWPTLLTSVLSAAAGPAETPRIPRADTVAAPITARIGTTGNGPHELGRVEALELGASGTVYVLDGDNRELRIFGADGRHLRSVGRQGEGPGEFEAPVGLAWSPSGELWVIDPENQRATTFTPSGDLLETHTLTAGFSLSPWPGRFDGEGRLYHYRESSESGFDYEMVRYDAGLVADAALTPPRGPEPGEFFEGRTTRGSDLRARVPFTPRFEWRLSSRGEFWSLWSGELRLVRHPANGEPVEIVRREAPRPAVARDERAAAIERLARFREMGGRIEVDRIPDRKPPVRTFVIDDRDRLWVLLERAEADSGSTLEVFSQTGAHLASVHIAADLSSHPTPVVREGRLVAVERDAHDIPSVVVADVGSVAGS